MTQNVCSSSNTMVLRDFPTRSTGTISAPADFLMTCDDQNATQVIICANSTASWSIDDAVCKQTDSTSSVQQRTCCGSGTCDVVPGDFGGFGSSKRKTGAIVGSVVGGAAVLVIALVLILHRWLEATPNTEVTDQPFPGDVANQGPTEADDFLFRGDEQASV